MKDIIFDIFNWWGSLIVASFGFLTILSSFSLWENPPLFFKTLIIGVVTVVCGFIWQYLSFKDEN